jgi:hypothetical protein
LNHTFNDEMMQEIISGSFIFWQRRNTSADGERFSNLYKIYDFPVICAIDPRTGRLLKTWNVKKFQDVHIAAESLTEFLDKYGDRPEAPVRRDSSATTTPVMRPAADPPVTDGGQLAKRQRDDAPEVATPVPEEPKKVVDLPPMPEEPGPEVTDVVKVAVKLISGGRQQRRFFSGDPVSKLFDFVSVTTETPASEFDLQLTHPTRSLKDKVDSTVKDAGLSGEMVLMTKSVA